MLAELIVRMAVDPSFAAWVRADPWRAGREYGLSKSDVAQLVALVDAPDEQGPVALGPRLSKSALLGPGLLAGHHPVDPHHGVDHPADPDHEAGAQHSTGGDHGTHGHGVPPVSPEPATVEWYDGVVTAHCRPGLSPDPCS